MHIFFAPHQDDELLTMGIPSLRLSADEKHVVLCTDGSQSYVKSLLKSWRKCDKHSGRHRYYLNDVAFVSARDQEFLESCISLEYKSEHIHYAPTRTIDGHLTQEAAQKMIIDAIDTIHCCEETIVHTMFPVGSTQHPDHTNLGLAAIALYEQHKIDQLYLYVEPYCIKAFYEQSFNVTLNSIQCMNQDQIDKLNSAISSYSKWDPKNKRYAIGYHSVTDLFTEFMKDPCAYQVEYHTEQEVVR